MTENRPHSITVCHDEENPLLWSVLQLLKRQSSGWKIHTLAQRLAEENLIPELDACPEKDLFKRNFLLMNALYQLQQMLLPDAWLQVESMDIRLCNPNHVNGDPLAQEDRLREYYLDWGHYDTDSSEVKRLLEQFWNNYKQHIGVVDGDITRSEALQRFELQQWASKRDIRQAWRKFAFQWHPDKEGGDAETFKWYLQAWSTLKQGF
ncbi:DNA-J related domain-containing protein [Vibrio hippocampi]|uniref:J domain-containing protein n=1 Tax=Vibrio hippocampi TaxID=654686 RepID=A0ABN8DMD4_9VIBR|nr:DNA-J related domain-containing protein [Vibrio hippocampi]CAH0529584.1 hypothetical protein VHP8226_03339 [Vibrio hippocampi]